MLIFFTCNSYFLLRVGMCACSFETDPSSFPSQLHRYATLQMLYFEN